MRIRRQLGLLFLAVALLALQGWMLRTQDGSRVTPEGPLSSPEGTTPPTFERLDRDTVRNPRDGSILVRVPAGPFLMGSEDSQAYADEAPRHEVDLGEFWIGKHAVTNRQFERFVLETGHDPGEGWKESVSEWGADAPVVHVTWSDAMSYCRWAGLTLPTEAQWEKAARGTDGRKFPWGDQWEVDRAWFFENSEGGIHPVDSRPQGASPYGCLNMAGNVWEWTSSVYRPYPYDPSDGREDPESQDPRISRGGAWYTYSRSLRCSRRCPEILTVRSNSFGFRVATPAAPR